MAISETQKVDYLWKKLAYGLSKTDTNANKRATNESIASPLLLRGENVWAQSALVPGVIPGSSTSVVTVYPTSSPDETTADSSATTNRTWKTGLTDWIPPEYGSTYLVKVYIHTAGQPGSAASSGTQVFGAGSGNNDEWFFDYQSGILHFIGTNLPSGISGKSVYVSGARYTGIKGVAVPGAGATFTSLGITGISTFFNTTDNTLGDANTGAVQIDGGLGINKNVTIGGNLNVQGYAEFVGVATFKGGTINLGDADTDDINVGGEFVSDLVPDVDDTFSLGTASKQWKNLFINGHAELDNTVISGVSTFSSPLDVNADVDIDGHTELDNVNIAGVTTFQSNAFFGDADYIQMGDAQDLKIGHVGSYSVILDQGEGNLSIGGDGFVDIMNTALNEYKARFTTNGSVELYFDNVNKFETTGYGATVFGTLQSQQLNVTGVSTYTGDADFNGHVDIDGHTELDNVNVSGIITAFDLDVDGHTELDNVNVSGVTTTSGLLDINAGGQANTFKVEDLTDNRVVIAGTGGELEDDANLTFNGSTLSVGVDLDVDGHTELDNVRISGVATFQSNAYFGDNDILWFGDGVNPGVVGDLSIKSDGTTSFIEERTSALRIYSDDLYLQDYTNAKIYLKAQASGSVELYYNNSKKFETTADGINVLGISTFSGAIDANGDLDVDGHTNLDNVDIAGVTTTSGLLDINAGGQANTFKVEDLTDNRVVIAGTGGELEDDANLTFNGSTLAVGVDLDVDGHTNLDNVSVAGVTTFTGAIDANGDLDVDGTTELDVLNVAETATFSANIDANGDLDVDGHTNLDNVSVAGVSTFTGAIDADGNVDVAGTLDVDGHTELDNVNISGIATATAFHTGAEGSAIRVTSNTISGPAEMFIDPAGVGDNTGALRIKGDLFVDGTQTVINSTTIELGDFIVGIATTATTDSLADGAGIKIGPDNTFLYDHPNTSLKSSENLNLASSKVYKIDGTDVLSATTLGSGVVNSSLTSLGTLLGLTVSGQTTLNTLGVTGVSTFTGAIDANGDLDVDGHTNLDNVSVAGVSTFNGNTTVGAPDVTNGSAGGVQIFASGQLRIQRDSSGTASDKRFQMYYGTAETASITADGTATFAGGITASGSLNLSGDLDVDGHTNLDNVSVVGVTTFTGAIDANGDLDVDGHTDLDNVSISGVTTFTGAIDANGNLDVAGTLDVDGHTELDNVNISGVVTATSINATTFIGDGDFVDIDVDGHTELDHVNIAGVVTATTINATIFAGNGDFVDIDVDGHTNLDNVSVAGVTTFAGQIVGAATNNVIPFLYSTMGDLPNAGTYHGAFAHVHNQAKGYFAHANAWYELVNKELNGTVGTGTERYNVGQIDATDVDVSGITTSVSLHVGVGGTVITASGIGSVGINSTTPAYALDVVGDINSSTDIKVNGVSIVSQGASLDDVVALAIALG